MTLAERVAAFKQWHYAIDLGEGVVTPIFREDHVNRHKQRARMFDEAMTQIGLDGKMVLDLGCNAGFWSLKALEAGAEFVVGVDGRQMHVDQAELVMETLVDDRHRYVFEVGNVFHWSPPVSYPFEVVLCLGLLYHVHDPVTLLQRCAGWSSDVIVVDTTLNRLPGEVFTLRRESTDDPRFAIDESFVMVPSRFAVTGILESLGFAVAVLRPRFDDWEGCADYRRGMRRMFVASRLRSRLKGLDVE